jgi:glutamate dehydrogenase
MPWHQEERAMAWRAEEQKRELIESVVSEIEARLDADEDKLAAIFARRYFRDVAPGDVTAREMLDLYGAAIAHLRFAEARPPGTAKVRVYNPHLQQHGWQSTHTVVEIVNDDMPFLVDSVAMEINRHGIGIHLAIHPIFAVDRDADGRLTAIGSRSEAAPDARPESFMHIEIDRQSDPAVLETLERDLQRILGDVRRAVEDWLPMRGNVAAAIADLEPAAAHLDADDLREIKAFLEWLADDHFTFLGYAAYALEGEGEGTVLRRVSKSGLGILRADEDALPSKSFMAMPLGARLRAIEPLPAIAITKANTKSTVHRATYLDFIGVKRYAPDGRVIGEHRIMGLFTSAAYNRSPRSIPLLRRKFDAIVERAGHPPASHAGKALVNILETYPRDELFQADQETLFQITTQILYLQDRQHIRLFLRQDAFERFVSCLIYIPRERYNTTVRERLQGLLMDAFAGSDSEFQAQVSESLLARILVIVRTPNGIPADVDIESLEQEIKELAQTWSDRLHSALIEASGEEEGNRLFREFGRAFPVGYQERVAARAAVPDTQLMDRLQRQGKQALGMSLYRKLEDRPEIVRFKLIRPDLPLYLSDALPILENMGLKILYEEPHRIKTTSGAIFAMHDFCMRITNSHRRRRRRDPGSFQVAFEQAWSGSVENDGFNRLVLTAGLAAADITVLRAYCKYILQLGSPFSQSYIEDTFTSNPGLAADLVALFNTRFDPGFPGDRAAETETLEQRIRQGLEAVAILDEDRILRRYLGLIKATLRTNAFQRGPEGRAKALPLAQVRSGARAEHAAAAPGLRDLRLFARDRGRASQGRQGRPWRPALVRPARGLPHRGPGPDEGADGQERGHRARGGEGRLLRQAPARRRRPPAPGRRGDPLLPPVPLGPVGHHRQPGPGCRGPARGRGPLRRRRPLPRRCRRQGHGDLLRHRQRRQQVLRLLARRRLRLGRLRRLRPQGHGHHRQGCLGIRQAALPRARHGPGGRPFTVIGIGDMSGDVFGNGMLCPTRSGCSPPSTTATSCSTRTRTPPSRSRSGNGSSPCPAPPGRTTTSRS